MGRWWMPDNGAAATGIHDSDGKWVSNGAYRSHAEKLITTHNADCDAYEARIAELERRCKTMMIQVAGRDEDEIGRVFSVDSVKCPYCKETTPLEEEGGHAEEVIGNFDHPYGNEECRYCGKNFYYEFEYFVLADAMTMEYDGTPIAEGRDNG